MIDVLRNQYITKSSLADAFLINYFFLINQRFSKTFLNLLNMNSSPNLSFLFKPSLIFFSC